MERFILASNNEKKLREMREILSRLGIELVSLREAGVESEPEETGIDFAENAMIKAEAAMLASGLPAISDDSGIVVEVLGGEPGVRSARYGGAKYVTDAQRSALLLKNMEGQEQRSAKFVSSIACVFPGGEKITAEGECCGEITCEPRGENGFGYDPIFFLEEYGLTMAELGPEVKNRISHRAKAIERFILKLEQKRKL